jgi:hypothetical protein
MARVGQRDLIRSCFIRDLRSGELGSMKILPDGTMTLLNHSDWQQRTVEAPLHPPEGIRVEPPVDGEVHVRRADLDRLYLHAGTAVARQSNDTESMPTREKQRPGIAPTQDWPNRLAPEIVRVAYQAPELLRNRRKLVRQVRKFLKDEIGWEPSDNKGLYSELDRLLSRIDK